MTTFETSEHLTTTLHNDGTLELAGLEETHWMTKQEAIEFALQILQQDYENGDYNKCLFCDGRMKVHEEEAKPMPILSDRRIELLKEIVRQEGGCFGISCAECPLPYHDDCSSKDDLIKAKQMLKELEE